MVTKYYFLIQFNAVRSKILDWERLKVMLIRVRISYEDYSEM
ncbi:hypothetical protein HNQ88_004023 [Aureibacter tunicatorum]|uniref:Uncharacterized protein n=1 Tax=Aureibacter tunicatorum TaxID=866807 RepID=A0AAE3XPV9_9BACT|nr:hypothetical protein [Aureibacter tunicatorum]BDD03727.1 hypothetical protein AUTU_12100 [Aureibacter tunicatorum]